MDTKPTSPTDMIDPTPLFTLPEEVTPVSPMEAPTARVMVTPPATFDEPTERVLDALRTSLADSRRKYPKNRAMLAELHARFKLLNDSMAVLDGSTRNHLYALAVVAIRTIAEGDAGWCEDFTGFEASR